MTRLTVYRATAPLRVTEETTSRDRIVFALGDIGVRLGQWPLQDIPDEAPAILDAYAPHIGRLRRENGYQAADVIRMRADLPDIPAMRAKFLDEHIHAEDEVRFFAEGSGAFYLREDDHVFRIICAAGDLLSVPAGQRHWFDMGPQPHFTAIRLFTNPEGWVAEFTGDTIAERIPPIDG